MAVFPDVSRPASRSCTTASTTRGGARSSRPVRSLSPALQIIQKSLLPDSPRVPDAPRGSRPREYLSAFRLPSADSQGMRHSASDWKGTSTASEASATRLQSPIDASVNVVESVLTGSASFRNRRPRTPDIMKSNGNAKRDVSQAYPMSARTKRSVDDQCDTARAPLSARVEFSRLPVAPRPCASEDQLGKICDVFPTDRTQENTKLVGTGVGHNDRACVDAMDALDALVASLDEETSKPNLLSRTLRPPKTKRPSATASELKCGIAPAPTKQTAMSEACKLGVSVSEPYLEASATDWTHADDSPTVHCSMSATLISVQYPGSPIPKTVESDDSDASVVLLTKPLASDSKRVRPPKVRFECHGPTAHVPQAPSRRQSGGSTSRPLGCTLVAFGGA